MHADKIKQIIEAGLENSMAIIEGEDGRHFTAIVVCPVFVGKSRVQRQQLVYTTLNNYIEDGSLHAISFKTLTPEEWTHSQAKGA